MFRQLRTLHVLMKARALTVLHYPKSYCYKLFSLFRRRLKNADELHSLYSKKDDDILGHHCIKICYDKIHNDIMNEQKHLIMKYL